MMLFSAAPPWKEFVPGGFPVAHAIWMLNEEFCRTAPSQPNLIQQQIAPEIVRRFHADFNTLPMMLAAYIGGPEVDKFLLRQSWSFPGDPSQIAYDPDWTFVSGQKVNRWLYLLGYLNDDAGREYRRQGTDRFVAMADAICDRLSTFIVNQDDINFLFLDPWLAKEYWPRFSRRVPHKPDARPLQTRWEYLVRMGDAAGVDMFVEAWKDTRISVNDYWGTLSLLDKLRPAIRHEAIGAIVRQVRDDAGNLSEVLKSLGQKDKPESVDRVIADLESHDPPAARLSEARRLFADLQKGPDAGPHSLWQNVPQWLAHTQPDSPLVAMLAQADKPELRLMVMGALTAYPTRLHQELLEKLIADPDPVVRSAAEKASQQLKSLAAEDPARYASDAKSPASTSADPAAEEQE